MINDDQLTPTQRAAAVTRAGENIALLSGAGCGKTYVLARRFSELLLANKGEENPLSRFVALTFTDKAALEMSQRVRGMLAEFASGSKGPDRLRWLGWLQELPDARISTIHGFCASMLRSYAIEAGVDPNFAVCAEPMIATQMCQEAADQAVLQAVEARRQDVAEALAMLSYDQLVEQVHRLVELRTSWTAERYRDPDQTLKRWDATLQGQREKAWKNFTQDQQLREQIEQLGKIPCSNSDDKLEVYRQEHLSLIRSLLDDPAARTAETFKALNKGPKNVGSAKNWGGKEQLQEVRNTLKSLVAKIVPLALHTEQLTPLDDQAAQLLATMTSLAGQAEAIYALDKRCKGLLDFTDLLVAANGLVAGNSAVRKLIGDHIDQLLIDEAQDTDAFQMAMLEVLVFGQAGGDSLPEGQLFLVGDAKQSIYRFRGAQVEVFEDLCRRLGRWHHESLDRSFRTHAAGVAFINHLFAPLMSEDYEPIRAHRTVSPPQPSVEVILAEGAADQPIVIAADASAAQAAVTAQRIGEMVSSAEQLVWDEPAKSWRPARYGDIAILFGRMTNSLRYERALALHEIPYYVVGGTGFFKRQEVFDLINALRVIDNPYDDVAFFGLLRSSLIGLDDNALMHIAETLAAPYLPKLAGPHGSQANAVEGLTDEASETLAFAVELLTSLHRRKDATGVDSIIDQLLEATGYEATLLSQRQGRRLLGNVRMLIERARSSAMAGANLADFITQIGELIAAETRYEQAAVSSESENVVRLMTIHKAKGLEFPVVFIPDLNAGRGGVREALLNRMDWGLTYKLRSDDDSQEDSDTPLSYRLAKRQEETDQQAEDIRRLYVAATRHKDHLVFIGADWRTKEGTLRDSSSYLARMDEVLGLTPALEAGSGAIPYDDGSYHLAIRRIAPQPPPRQHRKSAKGEKMLRAASCGKELADSIVKTSPTCEPPELLKPIPTMCGQVELGVTSLGQFEHCPMYYRWAHELGVQGQFSEIGSSRTTTASLDPATLGTLYHRCMELLDFSSPQAGSELIQQAVSDLGVEGVEAESIASDLDKMIEQFCSCGLATDLAEAREVRRELDFVMRVGSGTLRGRIDVLYQDAKGFWHVVDYKSDHVAPEDASSRAGRYELQMLVYSLAAAKCTGDDPVDAGVYFMRPGALEVFEIGGRALSCGEDRAARLVEQLIAARRGDDFETYTSDKCPLCAYKTLCRKP